LIAPTRRRPRSTTNRCVSTKVERFAGRLGQLPPRGCPLGLIALVSRILNCSRSLGVVPRMIPTLSDRPIRRTHCLRASRLPKSVNDRRPSGLKCSAVPVVWLSTLPKRPSGRVAEG
jgi:hypothetical protein